MASIKENPNGTFRARACVGRSSDGKQVWATKTFHPNPDLTPARAKADVLRRIDEWERKERGAYEAGHPGGRDRKRMTLSVFISELWPVHLAARDFAPNTKINMKSRAKILLEFFGEDIRISSIDRVEIDRLLVYLRDEKKYKPASSKMTFFVLNDILNYASKTGYIDQNPVADIEKHSRPSVSGGGNPDFLTLDEARSFLAALDEDGLSVWTVIFRTLLLTGIRRGEAVALLWSDFNPARRELTISKSATLTEEKPARAIVKATKNGRSRVVPVSPELAVVLEEWKREFAQRYAQRFNIDDCYIFGRDSDPTCPRNPTGVYSALRHFQKQHGLRETSVHDLRHSCASLLIQSGANLKQIQNLLGHATPEVTLAFYCGAAPDEMRGAVNTLSAAVGRTVKRKLDRVPTQKENREVFLKSQIF